MNKMEDLAMLLNQEDLQGHLDVPAIPAGETVIVETRFGAYEFTAENTIYFPHGLIGFAEHRVFGLANLPNPVPEDFKLLQSLGEPPVSFIVLPLSADEAPIDTDDLKEACKAVGCALKDAYFLFVCTVNPCDTGEGVDMSINLRAPIIFDMTTRRGRQYVFQHDRYAMQQPVEKLPDAVNQE